MMGLTETMLFYVVVGLAVTVAVWTAGAERPIGQVSPRFRDRIPAHSEGLNGVSNL